MAYSEEELRAAQIENLKMDTEYKRGLLKYEPWKVVLLAAGAGATFTLAMVALATFILAHLR